MAGCTPTFGTGNADTTSGIREVTGSRSCAFATECLQDAATFGDIEVVPGAGDCCSTSTALIGGSCFFTRENGFVAAGPAGLASPLAADRGGAHARDDDERDGRRADERLGDAAGVLSPSSRELSPCGESIGGGIMPIIEKPRWPEQPEQQPAEYCVGGIGHGGVHSGGRGAPHLV
mmetsp:Transcript_87118/g.244406  ORF Transcript_87118/g.244406 Transcript_87118/m.244406 type:complete len:176 (+) Transcript_87118:112-639(+)